MNQFSNLKYTDPFHIHGSTVIFVYTTQFITKNSTADRMQFIYRSRSRRKTYLPVSQEIWTLGNLEAASKFPRKSGRSLLNFLGYLDAARKF